MPRNAAGVYSLPNPPVVNGTVIDPVDENDTRDDLAAEITNSLDRSGRGGMLAPFRLFDGTVAAPGLSFTADQDNGLYRTAANDWSVSAGATQVLRFQANTVTLPSTAALVANGNVTLGSVVGNTLTVNAGTWTYGVSVTATHAAGSLAAGANSALFTTAFTHTAHTGGTSTLQTVANTIAANTSVLGYQSLGGWSHTLTLSGGSGNSPTATVLSGELATSGATAAIQTLANVISANLNHAGAAAFGGIVALFSASASLASGNAPTIYGYRSRDIGHATRNTTGIGFQADDQTASATVNAGFRSSMNSAATKWAFLAAGTAQSGFAGNVRIGSVVAPTVALDVTGAALISSTLGVTDTATFSGALNANGSVTLGDAVGDTLTINAGTWTIGSNVAATRAAGALATGTTTLFNYATTHSGDAGGASVARPYEFSSTSSGANAYSAHNLARFVVTHGATNTTTNATTLFASTTLSASGNVTNLNGVTSTFTLSSSGGATGGIHYQAVGSFTSTGAITTHIGYRANSTLGHATLVGTAVGFDAEDITTSLTATYGYRSQTTAGAGKLSFYDSGGAGIQGAGKIVSTGATQGIGYATGAGGTVTQATSKSTGVTLNTICGEIVMHNAALASNTEVAFTLTNSSIAATDVIVVNIKSGGTVSAYTLNVAAVAAGSCSIAIANVSAGSLSEAVVLSFAVIKAVAA